MCSWLILGTSSVMSHPLHFNQLPPWPTTMTVLSTKGVAPFLRHTAPVASVLLPPNPNYHEHLSVIGTSNPKSLTLQVSCTGTMNVLKLYAYYFSELHPTVHACKAVPPQTCGQPQDCKSFSFLLGSLVFSLASMHGSPSCQHLSSLHFPLCFQQL